MSVPLQVAAEFLVNSMIKLLEASERLGAIRAQGRDSLNLMEWQDILEGNDQARSDAQAAVDNLVIDEGS